MYTKDFDYNLPPSLIAQNPAEPRDSSRLMVVDRKHKTWQHQRFFGIVNFLQAGDLLVWNNSKVFKARLRGEVLLDEEVVSRGRGVLTYAPQLADKRPNQRPDDQGVYQYAPTDRILNMPTVEIFLVRPMENRFVWKVLAKPGRKLRLGMKVRFAGDFEGEVITKEKDGTILMQFADEDFVVREKANKYGEVPTPPYIRTSDFGLQTPHTAEDRRLKTEDAYQTVYAKTEGSVAAPTAGFHFTPELIEKLKNKGVEFAEVTLHVGLGTFLPVKAEQVEDHVMHSEWAELTAKNADLINAAKAEGRRVVAVGTTTVRVLEGVARAWGRGAVSAPSIAGVDLVNTARGVDSVGQGGETPPLQPFDGDLNLFITPGFQFQIVDALITNFHLPKSTLLMLVSAFAGDREFMLQCYKEAIEEKYRFYSFGDATFIY